jgi:hypothetical protein
MEDTTENCILPLEYGFQDMQYLKSVKQKFLSQNSVLMMEKSEFEKC